MKKLIPFIATAVLALQATAANFVVSSFLRAPVVSLMVSNNIGWTNLDYLTQVISTAAQTNSNGRVTNSVTGVGWGWYSNLPVILAGTNFQPQLTIITNGTPLAYNGGTNASGFLTNGVVEVTNSYQNVFVDVPLEGAGGGVYLEDTALGAAGQTNYAGMLVFRSWANSFQVPSGATGPGFGSNIVTVTFNPIIIDTTTPNGSTLNATTVYDVTDRPLNQPGQMFTVTFTNSAPGTAAGPTGAPTIYTFPVPRSFVQGCNALRVRNVYSGTTTNGVWIDKIGYAHWMP